MKKNVSQWGK